MNNEFATAVIAERRRQIELGYDRQHDIEHGVDHLLRRAQEYSSSGENIKAAALVEAAREILFRS